MATFRHKLRIRLVYVHLTDPQVWETTKTQPGATPQDTMSQEAIKKGNPDGIDTLFDTEAT